MKDLLHNTKYAPKKVKQNGGVTSMRFINTTASFSEQNI